MKSSGKRSRFPFDRFVKVASRYSTERSEVAVEHDLLAADEQDSLFDAGVSCCLFIGRLGQMSYGPMGERQRENS